MSRALPWQVAVVIPARNEERLIRRCLAAVQVAADTVRAHREGTSVAVYVVLDHCTDRTADIVAEHREVAPLPIRAGMVGKARAAGVRAFAETVADPSRAWVANTDADSVVPSDWLVNHLVAADDGYAMMVGMVALDRSSATRELLEAWGPEVEVADGHPHVYGANLGLTLQTYLRLGGFAEVAAHEDAGLVRAARERGLAVLASAPSRVLTSPRLQSRAPDGLGAYLRALLDPPAATSSAAP